MVGWVYTALRGGVGIYLLHKESCEVLLQPAAELEGQVSKIVLPLSHSLRDETLGTRAGTSY